MSIAEEKAALRSVIRAARRAIGDDERRSAALAVAKSLGHVLSFGDVNTVLGYMPMRYELDITPALELLKGRGVRIAYPLCTDEGGLRLFAPDSDESFTSGAYGISEPVPERSTEITADELDAIILPAIGFDPACRRLGQGGGYYDRLLARSSCMTVAVGFDCQLVEFIPTERTDRPVDVVVTPTVVYHRAVPVVKP